jgi:hypothetical protein
VPRRRKSHLRKLVEKNNKRNKRHGELSPDCKGSDILGLFQPGTIQQRSTSFMVTSAVVDDENAAADFNRKGA